MIEQVIGPLVADGAANMSTVCCSIRDAADYGNPNVVKVVSDGRGHALYFSRAAIPHMRDIRLQPAPRAYKHIGLYGFRRTFLLKFSELAQTPLELSESLEQLRALEHGYGIHTVETQYDSIGVDTPEDLDRVRRQLLAVPART
jgi:3-deoxy-manno-octulosonate cytidylyltransferase (CMP-KDO synthetase)